MARLIKVYVIRYRCVRTGKLRWLPESYDSKLAFALGRKFAKEGCRPVVIRIDALPEQLLKAGVIRERAFYRAS